MQGALLGKYRVVEQLGEGGMGVVYIGRHEALASRVVLKVLRPEMSRNADMVRRFFNEAQAATAIHHPGIVQVFDFGATPDGRAYFVMELLEGETLGARIHQRRLDSVETCRIGRQVANVLQAAHTAGITHRDLKPDNLFLVPDPEVAGGERVKVLDFGIAKLASELHASGVKTRADLVMGTPSYMSPEQCRGAAGVDTRTDIYSLACILFKMMCGRAPFIGHGAGDIIGAHLHVPPPDLRRYAPEADPALEALIAKMLEKHPDARPQTMAEVSQSLDEILHALGGPLARPSTPLPVLSRPAPRQLPGLPPVTTPAAPVAAPTAPAATTTSPASSLVTTLPAASPVPREDDTTLADVSLVETCPVPRTEPSLAETRPVSPPVLPSPRPAPPPAPSLALAETQPMPRHVPPAPPVQPIPPAPAPLPRRDATPPPAPAPAPWPRPPSNDTTLGGSAGMTSARDRPHPRRLPYVLAGLVIAGAVAAIAIVLANRDPEPADRPSSAESGSASPLAVDAGLAAPATVDAAVPAPPPLTADAAAAAETAEPPSADELASECRGFQVDRKWDELAQCAARLKPLDPELAGKLETRAAEEAKAAPRIAAVEDALRDRDLRRAAAELEQVWPESVDLPKLKHRYAASEAQVIAGLVSLLESALSPSCTEYRALLARAQAAQPPHVITEATRQVACTPLSPTQCDATALAEKGRQLHAAGKLVPALASYESSWICKTDPSTAKRGFIIACNIPNLHRAKVFWKRLTASARQDLLTSCQSNQITAQMLDAP